MNDSSSPGCDYRINGSAFLTFLPVLYGSVFCVGLPTNCLALYGLYRLVKANYSLPIYAINLLLADLLQIATLPFWIHYYHTGLVWHFVNTFRRVLICISFISLFANIYFMCCISLERYLAIVHPPWFQHVRKFRNACLICLCAWMANISLVIISVYSNEQCNKNACRKMSAPKKNFSVFNITVISFSFFLTLAFLLIFFFRARKRLVGAMFLQEEDRKRISHVLLLIIVIFLLVFGPYHVVCHVWYVGTLVVKDKDMCVFKSEMFVYHRVSLSLLSLYVILNPIMYIFIRTDIKQTLHLLACCPGICSLMNFGRPSIQQEDGQTPRSASESNIHLETVQSNVGDSCPAIASG